MRRHPSTGGPPDFLPGRVAAGRGRDGGRVHAADAFPGSPAAVVACALLLTVGTLIGYPYEMESVVAFAGQRLVATHYGVYPTIAGIAITAGTAATGRCIDFATIRQMPAAPGLPSR